MKKLLFTSVLLLIFSGLYAQSVDKRYVDGRIYVKLKQSAKKIKSKKTELKPEEVYFVKDYAKKYSVKTVKQPFVETNDTKLSLTYAVNFKDYKAIDNLIGELKLNNNIEYIEKAPLFYTSKTKSIPNDEFYSNIDNNWYLKQIKAEECWDITTGSEDIVVAVIDDAVDITHPDLQNKIHLAYDVANDDDDPNPPVGKLEDFSHGTHCAGLIAAETNNETGIASIGYNVKIMAIKASRDTDDNSISSGYEGIIYAADNGADVLSLSWGGSGSYQVLQNVVNYAYNKGCVLVAAAGNDGNDGNEKHYPACYNHVISVGAVNYNDMYAWFSQYGDDKVDVCAPGGSNANTAGLLSTVPYHKDDYNGKYDTKSGTSMATPVTAGLCALMLSVNPELTPEKLGKILFATCKDISVLNTYKGTGHGRINAYEAVKAAQDAIEPIYADFYANKTITYAESYVIFSDTSSESVSSYEWTFQGGTPSSSNEENPKVQYLAPGTYSVTLTVSDGTNSSTETKTSFITVLEKGFGTEQATGFSTASRGIEKISIADENTVWAWAYDGANPSNAVFDFTRTTDGGENWQTGKFPMKLTMSFSDIFALNADTAWAAFFDSDANSGGGIFRTNNSGANWIDQTTAVYSGADAFTNTVYFFDKDNGWSMGDPNDGYFEIYTTENGGETWTRVERNKIPINLPEEYGTVGLCDGYGEATAWFSTNKGRVFKTTDKGATWTVKSTGLTSISSISFADSENGLVQENTLDASNENYTGMRIAYTNDGGESWSEPISIANTKGFYTQTEVVKGAPGIFISIGSNLNGESGSSYSMDYGKSWNKIDDTQYTDVEFYNEFAGWAGAFNESETSGGIFKWSRLFDAIEDIMTAEKAGIFPNPTSGLVNIHAKTRFHGKIKLELFNISGVNVFTKEEMNYSEGVYSTTIDMQQLEKGIYFCRIKAGNQIFSNKIILE